MGIGRDKPESAGRSCGASMFQAEGTAHAKALRWEVGQGGAQSCGEQDAGGSAARESSREGQ